MSAPKGIVAVATRAGVSKSLVSRVFNGGRVDPIKAVRVRAVAKEMGYVADPVAAAMRTGNSELVGVMRDALGWMNAALAAAEGDPPPSENRGKDIAARMAALIMRIESGK